MRPPSRYRLMRQAAVPQAAWPTLTHHPQGPGDLVRGAHRDGHPQVIRTVVFDASERLAYERELLAARHRAEESEARVLTQTLQRSFLPPVIITVPGLDIGGAYRPAGDGTEVGGDFYDMFPTGPDTWGVVLGDVCGKGVSATVVTVLARYTVRAEALRMSPRPPRSWTVCTRPCSPITRPPSARCCSCCWTRYPKATG
jgi:hypothetical protein